MTPTELHDTYWITWHLLNYMTPTELHDTYWITWHLLNYMTPTELHDTYWITWHLLNYMTPTELHETYWITWHLLNHMTPTELHDTYWITWHLLNYMLGLNHTMRCVTVKQFSPLQWNKILQNHTASQFSSTESHSDMFHSDSDVTVRKRWNIQIIPWKLAQWHMSLRYISENTLWLWKLN